MKKQVTQDILPAKKTIRDIEIPSRSREESKRTPKYSPKEDVYERSVPMDYHSSSRDKDSDEEASIRIDNKPPKNPPPPTSDYKYSFESPKRSKKSLLYVGISIGIVGFAFLVSSLFKSATVQITPISQTKVLDESFSAKKDDSSAILDYQIVTITKDVEKAVDPKDVSSEQKVERKAKGTIIIYNNFGSSPQNLVATTRFETPEGLIFRLINAVTIPGTYTKDGKKVPGSVEAEVIADQAGQNYNVGLKDFTVPGLKNDPAKYKTIYARSKTEMSGGFSGTEKVVSQDVLSGIEKDMETTLRASLASDVINQIPSEFVMFPISLDYKFEAAQTFTATSGSTVVKKKGVVNAIIFNRKNLTKVILGRVLPDADPNLIRISNMDALVFSLDASSVPSSGSINFNLKGEASLVWVVDIGKLKNDLLGLSKSNAKTVMSAYPSIKEAWVMTRPFWNNKIPTNPKKVTIINALEPK